MVEHMYEEMGISGEAAEGSVRAVARRLASVDLDSLARPQLEARVVGIRRAIDTLEGEWLRWVGEADRRRVYGRDGHTSATAWLAHAARMAPGSAHNSVRLSRRLPTMGETTAALGEGLLSFDQMKVLAGAAEAHPEAFSPSEETLVASAETLSVPDLTRLISYWRQPLDDAAGEESPRPSELYFSETFQGRGRLDADLDRDGRELVAVAFEAATSPPDRADHRTPAQRRADAFLDICRSFLDSGEAPATGGVRPHLTLVVDYATLASEKPGGRCEYASGVVTHPGTARALACDATACRILYAGREFLDLGRTVRVVPPALRRVVIARDRHCVWPGCDRRPALCDVHHLVHWVNGGPTDLGNLALLRLSHESG